MKSPLVVLKYPGVGSQNSSQKSEGVSILQKKSLLMKFTKTQNSAEKSEGGEVNYTKEIPFNEISENYAQKSEGCSILQKKSF